jgi:hypothetical protein
MDQETMKEVKSCQVMRRFLFVLYELGGVLGKEGRGRNEHQNGERPGCGFIG